MRDPANVFLRFVWFGVFLGVLIGIALSHEWYPHECCSDRDCWPTGVGEREPDPVEVVGGWRLHDGTFVSHKEAMPSPDGRFHVCRQGGGDQRSDHAHG